MDENKQAKRKKERLQWEWECDEEGEGAKKQEFRRERPCSLIA